VAPSYDIVLLDLDGTIIDSEPGIHVALRHALQKGFGITPTAAELAEFMGPPLADILPRVFGLTDPADETRFYELYCEKYFHDAEYEFDVYPGMAALIADLADSGTLIALATAKPDVSASRILERAGLRDHFVFVGGSHEDGSRQDKIDVLTHTLDQIDGGGHHRIVMVGDRAIDVRAADAHDLDSVVVTWGYAPEGELDHAGATHLVTDVAGLRSVLLG